MKGDDESSPYHDQFTRSKAQTERMVSTLVGTWKEIQHRAAGGTVAICAVSKKGAFYFSVGSLV